MTECQRFRAVAAVAVGAILAAKSGCARSRVTRAAACTLMSEEIVLKPAAPLDRQSGVRLVRVKPDGTAVIRVTSTGETLAAAPGGYFLGAYDRTYHVRTFGEHGLQLATSDPSTKTAVLLRTSAE